MSRPDAVASVKFFGHRFGYGHQFIGTGPDIAHHFILGARILSTHPAEMPDAVALSKIPAHQGALAAPKTKNTNQLSSAPELIELFPNGAPQPQPLQFPLVFSIEGKNLYTIPAV